MRVLLSAFACAPRSGSEPGVGWHWALEVARLGHEVVVLTRARHRLQIEAERDAGRLPASLRFDFLMPDWLGRLAARGLPLQLVHLAWQLVAWRHARRRLRGERFDLVHHITYCVIRQPSFMGRLPVPFVLGPVGGGERAPWALRSGMGARGWLVELARDGLNRLARVDPITRQALAAARLIYVSSPDTARLVPKRHQGKVRIGLQVGIDLPELRPEEGVEGPAGGPLRLLFVGRCLAWKGMHIGLAALAELLARGRRARLTIAGTGTAAVHWRAQAHRLGIDDALDWLAWVEHDRMAAVYLAHDVLLFPSLHDSGGQAVLEALAHGRPVACFDLGGPGSIVDASCGRVVVTRGRRRREVVRNFADALQELADSPALRVRLGEGARVRAARYAWPCQVAAVYAEIEQALRPEGAAGSPAPGSPPGPPP
jgi:glycosyltransferase involved in cell wall biosynthesis